MPLLSENSGSYYTHYGSVDALLDSIVQILGVISISDAYLVALGISAIALTALYVAISVLFNRVIAIISTALISTSSFCLTVAESPSGESFSLHITIFALLFITFTEKEVVRDKAALATFVGAWLNFLVAGQSAFRYYRLLIQDKDFLSMAEIKFYEEFGAVPAIFLDRSYLACDLWRTRFFDGLSCT